MPFSLYLFYASCKVSVSWKNATFSSVYNDKLDYLPKDQNAPLHEWLIFFAPWRRIYIIQKNVELSSFIINMYQVNERPSPFPLHSFQSLPSATPVTLGFLFVVLVVLPGATLAFFVATMGFGASATTGFAETTTVGATIGLRLRSRPRRRERRWRLCRWGRGWCRSWRLEPSECFGCLGRRRLVGR